MQRNKSKTPLYLYAVLLLFFGVFKFYGGINSVIDTIRDNWFYIENFDHIGFIPMNLIPFHTIGKYISRLPSKIAIINLFGNIIMFLPLGFLLPFTYQKLTYLKYFLIASCGIAVCCEVLQLITFTGTLDIDDCILAVCGCLIGYTVYHLFSGKDEQK